MVSHEREELISQIVDLQTQLTFQEDTIQILNEVVARQQQDILELQSQINTLITEFKVVIKHMEPEAINQTDMPPHY